MRFFAVLVLSIAALLAAPLGQASFVTVTETVGVDNVVEQGTIFQRVAAVVTVTSQIVESVPLQ